MGLPICPLLKPHPVAFLLSLLFNTGGAKVSTHTLGLIPPPCFIFERCCFANSIQHTVPTCSRIPSPKFENSNILDHAHSILKHLYCSFCIGHLRSYNSHFFRTKVIRMAKHNPIKFGSIRLSKLSNKCKNEPSFDKNEHEYFSISQIPRTCSGQGQKDFAIILAKKIPRFSTDYTLNYT